MPGWLVTLTDLCPGFHGRRKVYLLSGKAMNCWGWPQKPWLPQLRTKKVQKSEAGVDWYSLIAKAQTGRALRFAVGGPWL